jgi:hypothetical protein
LAISDKLKWPHRYKNWYKTILNSTQNKNKVYHKTNLNNIKLQVFRTIYTGRNFLLLSKASEKGKCTLFKAVGLRKDDVHRRLHDEFDSLDLIPTDRIQYQTKIRYIIKQI